MFAILETGSKQYKVEEGDVLEVELLEQGKISKDNTVNFESVLLVKDKELHIGQPFVQDAFIQAKILDEFKAPKVIVFKKKSKKQYKRTRGHRQKLHRIQVEKIAVAGSEEPEAKKIPEKTETQKETPTQAEEKAQTKPKTKPETKTETKAETKTKAKPKTKTETKTKKQPEKKKEKE